MTSSKRSFGPYSASEFVAQMVGPFQEPHAPSFDKVYSDTAQKARLTGQPIPARLPAAISLLNMLRAGEVPKETQKRWAAIQANCRTASSAWDVMHDYNLPSYLRDQALIEYSRAIEQVHVDMVILLECGNLALQADRTRGPGA